MADTTGPFRIQGASLVVDDDEPGTYLSWAEEAASRKRVADAVQAAGWAPSPTAILVDQRLADDAARVAELVERRAS